MRKSLIVFLFLSQILILNAKEIAYTIEVRNEFTNKLEKVYPIERLEIGEYQTNSIYIKTKNQEFVYDKKRITSNVIQSQLQSLDMDVMEPLVNQKTDNILTNSEASKLIRIDYNSPVDAYDICIDLMNNPDIEYAVPVFNAEPTFTPNDPRLNNQWHISNLELEKAWEITKGSPDIIIGIVDSGTDWQHEDLSDNIWINTGEIPDNGIDDDGNGFVDDVYGWDFVGNININQALNRQWQPDNNPRPMNAQNSHGTHVAGCASAATNNGKGVAAPGFNTKIMAIKCGSDNWNQSAGGTRSIFRPYEGIIYAAENGAQIINCSWGRRGGYNPAEQEIINSTVEAGVLVIASSGNDGLDIDLNEFYPANYQNIFCVGATSSNNRRAGFSNYGYRVDVYSPGNGILATNPFNNYGNASGTSMAGPVAAGVAALILAKNPTWNNRQIAAQLRSTSLPVANVSDNDKPKFFGRINAFKAVNDRVPGVRIYAGLDGQNDVISNFDENQLNLQLVNLLEPVAGLRIDFIKLDKFIDLSSESIVVNNLKTLDTTDLELSVTLNDLNPWYHGTARILVKFTANNYEDYQVLELPISLESNNVHSVSSRFEEVHGATFLHSHSPRYNEFWAVGFNRNNNAGIVYNNLFNRILYILENEIMTGVYAVSSNEAWVTTGSVGNNSTSRILHTTNGGQNWDEFITTSNTKFMNGIYFFDDKNGLAFGDPQNNVFAMMITTNGGQSWSPSNNQPGAFSGETGIAGSFATYEDRIWIGTTAGRVLRSRDMGKTWNVYSVNPGANIIDIAFSSDRNGIAIYTNPGDPNVYLARSTDGGLNWRANELNFAEDMGIRPVAIEYKEDAELIFLSDEKAKVYTTKDVGRNWVAVLNRENNEIGHAAVGNTVENYSLWQIGEADAAKLDFKITPAWAKALLVSTVGDSFTFDTTEVNKIKLSTVDLRNDGDISIVIEDVLLSENDEGHFTLMTFQPQSVAVGEVGKFGVRFTPKSEGLKTAKLTVKSNNEAGDINVNLSGVAIDISSVKLPEYVSKLEVFPNPAKSESHIRINSEKSSNLKIMLLNSLGIVVADIFEGNLNLGESLIHLDTESLSSGTYYLNFESEGNSFIRTLNIVR